MVGPLFKVACVISVALLLFLSPIGATCQDLNRELKDAEKISDPYKKASTLLMVSTRYKKMGEVEKAAEILNRSLAIADEIKLPSYKAIIFIKVAEQHALSGRADASADILSRAIEIIEILSEGRYKDNFIARIANVYADSGDKNKAIQWANRISDPGKRVVTLGEVKKDRTPPPEEEEKVAEPVGPVPVAETSSREPEASEEITLPAERADKAPQKIKEREDLSGPAEAEITPAYEAEIPGYEEGGAEEDEKPKAAALSRYRVVWFSAGGKGVTPSFSGGIRVGHIGFEAGFRSSQESVGGNYGVDLLVFVNPYNRLSLYIGPGIYIENNSENEDITVSLGIQTFFSDRFVVGFGYHSSRGFNGSVGIQF